MTDISDLGAEVEAVFGLMHYQHRGEAEKIVAALADQLRAGRITQAARQSELYELVQASGQKDDRIAALEADNERLSTKVKQWQRQATDILRENNRLGAENYQAEAENAKLREALDKAQLSDIEARNPGIDMEEVKRWRASTDREASDG